MPVHQMYGISENCFFFVYYCLRFMLCRALSTAMAAFEKSNQRTFHVVTRGSVGQMEQHCIHNSKR
jgi:hypothetical protein